MKQIYVMANAVMNAHPEEVYAAIADYRHGHPHIIPKEIFSDLQVETGGYGAGTIMTFGVKVMGGVKTFRQRVSEPQPGRVLVEQDIDTPQNTTTTFTVIPVENGQKAHVEIATTMHPSAGLAGMVERVVVPMLYRRVYRKELKLLEAFAQRGSVRIG
jgi:hypothetical protein